MNVDVSRVTSSAYLPHLLIAERNFSTVEPLLRTVSDSRLDVDFEVCTTHLHAIRKLSAFPYQLIISSAHLAEMDDFLLLKRTQALETAVPLVVTANASERESARRVLRQGAFDLIAAPVDHEQAVRTIRLALWQGRLTRLIARKEKAVDKYHQHLAEYPTGRRNLEESFNKALAAFEKTIASVEGTILRIEESTVCLSDFATKVEHYVRKRALERLAAE